MTAGKPPAAVEGGGAAPSSAPPPRAPADWGDPAAEYAAATEGLAVFDRSHRLRLAFGGRAPGQVLVGLVSGRVPGPLEPVGPGVWRGRAEGSALLTPKGRMVAELRVTREGPGAEAGFLFDLPREAADPALEHLRKLVPPRLATVRDVSAETSMVTVVGPAAAAALEADGRLPLERRVLDALADGDLVRVDGEGAARVTSVRTAEVAAPAFDLLGPRDVLEQLVGRLLDAGAARAGLLAWETLRVEAGRPAWGAELDETVIPVEAGIHPRIVDYAKGCFTGQEVLVRIRDRGRVNRHLRGLRLGQVTLPPPGTSLHRPGEEREVGKVTSAARSPRFGETIGLGYVRREVEPPAVLRLGGPEGTPVSVHDLEADWRVAREPGELER